MKFVLAGRRWASVNRSVRLCWRIEQAGIFLWADQEKIVESRAFFREINNVIENWLIVVDILSEDDLRKQ